MSKTAYVTITGECFDLEFQRKERASNRDGALYLFHVIDLVKNRGERLISIFRFGPDKLMVPNYDARIENIRINTIRRRFDSSEVNFDAPVEDEHRYQELSFQPSDFKPQPPSDDAIIRQYIIHKAFYGCYKLSTNPANKPLTFDEPLDLDYLGISKQEMTRNVWYLAQQGLLDKADIIPGTARATGQLVRLYESQQATEIAGTKIFPKGTQFDGFKAVREIFRSAQRKIFITDNYLSDDVLDVIAALPVRPSLQLLTYQPKADFRAAIKRFQSQYNRPTKVRLHQAEIHDRTIVIDDRDFYSVGSSIKDIGTKLSLLTKLQDAAAISQLKTTLDSVWTTATPLS